MYLKSEIARRKSEIARRIIEIARRIKKFFLNNDKGLQTQKNAK